MKSRVIAISLAGATLSVATGLLSSTLPGCAEQPEIECVVGRASFFQGYASKFKLVEGTGACASIPGDVIGVQKYNPSMPGEGMLVPDLEQSTIALQVESMAGLAFSEASDPDAPRIDDDTAHKLYSLGALRARSPDESNLCYVDTFQNAAELELDEFIPPDAGDEGGTDGGADAADDVPPPPSPKPAVSQKYEWSNVKFYVTAGAPGTQMAGTVKVTQDGCTATYDVTGVWPNIFCGTEDANGNMVPDEDFCKPVAVQGKTTHGSGINPDFPVRCDPDLLLCVLTGEGIPQTTAP